MKTEKELIDGLRKEFYDYDGSTHDLQRIINKYIRHVRLNVKYVALADDVSVLNDILKGRFLNSD